LLALAVVAHEPADVMLGLAELEWWRVGPDRRRARGALGRMQHVDVQRVALDPFAAVDQPAQCSELTLDTDAARVLHRMHGAHLIRDRADAADACGNVRRLGELPSAQERLEESRWLENLQLHVGNGTVLDLHEQRALAFDAGEVIDFDRAGSFHGVAADHLDEG